MALPLGSLAGHALVIGITGSGKTNTTKWLLQEMRRNQVPFLVIEPAKREYASLGRRPDLYGDVEVFTLGDEMQNPLRLNPLEFVPGFPLLTHIDRLKSIFNAAFPMYAAMPYMLEEALLSVFTDRGWDLATSENLHLSDREGAEWWEYLPTLEDLYDQIDRVVLSKGYAAEPTANYAAALKARISSLMVGSKGMMLNVRRSFPVEMLLGASAVVQFTGLGDDDEKCFAMGLLFNLLGEYREVASRDHEPSGLQHVCVVEEAHRLLRQTGSVDNPEVASPRAKAVETFANMLAEMRALGQGFILADQIPSKLLSDAIKNTNLKIVHRLVAADDVGQMAVGMDLEDDQRRVVVKLPTGQAVVRAATDDSAFLIQIPRVDETGDVPPTAVEGVPHPADAPRWVVCGAVCNEPCRHYARLANMRGAAVDATEEFIHRLAFGRTPEAISHWDWLRGEVRSRVRASVTLSDGPLTCLAVSDLQDAARQTADAYGGDWGHYDLLLRALRSVLERIGNAAEQAMDEAVNPVADALASIGSGHPMVDVAACFGCGKTCVYGPLGRIVWRRLANTLGSRPTLKGPAPMPSPEQLTSAIKAGLPWLDDVHLQPLTYCVSIWMRTGSPQR
ncbi:MAG: ATP-binding protein [Armatimonadota bacterium]